MSRFQFLGDDLAMKQARACSQFIRRRFRSGCCLVGDHPLQLGLIRVIGDNRLVQLVLALARLGRQDVAREGVLANHFPCPGFFEPFGRAFMCLEFGHGSISGNYDSITKPGRGSCQLMAVFTRARICASIAGVSDWIANATGQKVPASRCALSLKPSVEYLVLNFDALWKKQTMLPSFA